MVARLLLALLLPVATFAQGRFDLPSGKWTSPLVKLEVRKDHSMTLRGNGGSVTGHYTVSASKGGEAHARLEVSGGQGLPLKLGQLTFSKGASVRLSLRFEVSGESRPDRL